MEALLSLAFDNLSSYDGPKIKKGLKQIEALLAPICLPSTRARKRQSIIFTDGDTAPKKPPKTLDDLANDPAFFAFFKLQEGFEWNIAQRLLDTLDRLLARGSDGQNDLLILSTLDLTQGVLLLHPPSRVLFAREKYMNVRWAFILHSSSLSAHQQLLLDLLEPVNCPAIQSATLLALVVALLDTPQNTRTFEALDGLLTVTSIFKARSTTREVRLKLVEFLYFYLMPERPERLQQQKALRRSPSKSSKALGSSSKPQRTDDEASYADTLTTDEKQALLGRHLHNVDELVRDLTTHKPFGDVAC